MVTGLALCVVVVAITAVALEADLAVRPVVAPAVVVVDLAEDPRLQDHNVDHELCAIGPCYWWCWNFRL